MPLPPLPRALVGPRRRTLLASAAGAVLLAGCSDAGAGSGGTGGDTVSARARARAARDSRELVALYDAVIAAHPGAADRLRPLRAEVAAHAEAFGAGTAAPSGSPSGTPSGSPRVSASPTVPADEKHALAALAAAERTLADRRAKTLLTVEGELARLLASVVAAGAAHLYLLTEGAK